MAFTLDTETQKITFGVVSDGTNDAISLPLADQFGATEDFNDDFSSYTTQGEADASWVSADTTKTRVNITTDKLDFNIIRDDTNDAIVHDFGSVVSDTQWVLRFKLQIDTLNQSALQSQGWIGLFDKNQVAGEETTQSGIGIVLTCLTGTLTYRIFDVSDALLVSGVDTIFTHALSVETLYIEIKRTSSTAYTVSLYSDPNYTALIESISGTCAIGLNDLRYIGIKNNMSATLGSSILGSMDDVQLWDGISTPVIRSDNWRIRFKLDITNLDNGGNSIDKRLYIGLFDEDATSGADNLQDGYLLMLAHDNTDNLFIVRTPDGQQPRLASDDATFSTAPAVTTRWIELRKDNASQTTTSIYSDSAFTTLVESKVVAGISGSDNLRYLKLMNDVGFTGAGAIDGTFDDFSYVDISDTAVPETFTIDALLEQTVTKTWQLREHDINATFSPNITFQSEVASPNRLQVISGTTSIAGGYTFKVFPKADILGSDIHVTWLETPASIDTSCRIEIYDGAYDATSLVDFPNNSGTFAIKGAGSIGFLQVLNPNPEQTDTLPASSINYAGSTESFITVFINFADTNTGLTANLFIKDITVTEVATFDFTPATVSMYLTGTINDYGYANADTVTLNASQTETFMIDGVLTNPNTETFTIDGIPFAPPAILFGIDARLFLSDFGDFRDIGDLIIRVLTENPSGLTGDEIVDEIRIITEMEPEWGFLGKTHRVKGWINYLFKNGTIQNDGSDPDWWQSVWTLV